MTAENLTIQFSLDEDAEGWLESLAQTLRPKGKNSAPSQLELYAQGLDKRPNLTEEVRNCALAFLGTRSLRGFLCEAGIHWGNSLLASLSSRMLGKVLPPPPRSDSIQDAVRQAFASDGDAQWLNELPDSSVELVAKIFQFSPDLPAMQKCRAEMATGLEILSHRLATLGLDSELLRNAPDLEKYESPFLAQNVEVGDLLRELSAELANAPDEETIPKKASDDHLLVLLSQCQDSLARVQRQVKRTGSSLYLTYHLVSLEGVIERIGMLSGILTGRLNSLEMWRFFLSLCSAENRRHSVQDLLRQHWRTIALQIVRQAGETGDHYIAHDRLQLHRIFRAALGAGLLIGIMAMVKIQITALHLPPLLQAICYSGDYAVGFVIIHLLGFTVATKQPAMTAAALAASIPEAKSKGRPPSLEGVADLCVMTARSQFWAIMGNVLLAFPTAVMLSWLWQLKFGQPIATPLKAEHLLQELSPFPAILYAALAGVGLFLAGLVSGYFDNLSNYYAIPDRIRHSPVLRKWLGKRTEVWARVAEKETGALAGNVAFGIFLGMMSGAGPMMGIPLDIRHVSFSSANVGFAMQAGEVGWATLAYAWLGVALIGVTNLAVSFGLALWTAASARGIGRKIGEQLGGILLGRLRRRPAVPPALTSGANAVDPKGVL